MGTAGDEENKAFRPVSLALENVVKASTDVDLKTTVSLKELLPAHRSKFYRYSGSLTTPGCQEIVTWTVFESPIQISHRQLVSVHGCCLKLSFHFVSPILQ